jgi:para-nitrobenzyl esterase
MPRQVLVIVLAMVGVTAERGLPAKDSQGSPVTAAAMAQAITGCVTGADVVCTESGAVRGTMSDGVRAFKGIPYAKPPVGPLRFRPPQPADPWQGIRPTDRFGPICPQIGGNNVVEGGEDCLTLNIWTPPQPPSALSPVMVFLTGGGNHGQSGSAYDGSLMVQRAGVVFVTYNLRLGVLGFLAHPALDLERPERISGNYGSLDQIEMLQWVRRNIRNFGGDPGRVFLFGTSAGGGNLCALMTSPLAQGLFHGVAMQSSVPTGCEVQTLADMEERTGARVAAATQCATATDVAACLRSKTVDQIVSAVRGVTDIFPRMYGPNVDGHVFPDQPARLIRSRRYTPMPVIIGTTADETRGFLNAVGPVTDPATYAEAVARLFGSHSRDAILGQYPAASFPAPRAALEAATTDAYFTCTTRRVARLLSSAQDRPVYRYFFTHALENDPRARTGGSSHTLEHRFLFPWTGAYQPSDNERRLQDSMVLYWSRMARTGDPNGAGNLTWPRYDVETDPYLELAPDMKTGAALRKTQCDFWDTVSLPWPHL